MKISKFCSTLCLALTVTSVTHAGQKAFIGTKGTDWDLAENWDPAGIPTGGDEVIIRGADVVIGEKTAAVAAGVSIASEGGVRAMTLDGTLNTGVFAIGGELPDTVSRIIVRRGTLCASRIEMSPGDGKSVLCVRGVNALNLAEGKGTISTAGGKGVSELVIDGEVGSLGLASCETSAIFIGSALGAKVGALDVVSGQTYTSPYVYLANSLTGENCAATLTISGGTINAKNLLFNPGKDTSASNSTVDLNSGILRANQILLAGGGGTQTFNWRGGSIGNLGSGELVIGCKPDVGGKLTISLSAKGTRIFEVDDGSTAQFQPTAVLADMTGERGTFIKGGRGTLEIRSASTYTGATTVNEGELLLSGNGSINSSAGISVARAAKFTNRSSVAPPAKTGWLSRKP